jgi:hypothetical protein
MLSCKSKVRTVHEHYNHQVNCIGCWINVKRAVNSGYPDLKFSSDSIAEFSSIADTVYRIKYWLKDSHLYLFDGKKVFICPIVKLTDSVFYFIDSMVEDAEIHYKRTTYVNNKDTVFVISADGNSVTYSDSQPPPPPTKDDLKREKLSIKKKGAIKIVKDCCTAEDSLEAKPPVVDK